MFVARLASNAHPIGVLLGGSGKRQTVSQPKSDVGALLSKPYVDQAVSAPTAVGFVDPLRKIGCHD